jgi:4-carboxymuconolactone decarboxylase
MDRERFARGMEIRRKVIGDDGIEARMDSADPLTRDFLENLVDLCWGTVWTRPGLAPEKRSLVLLGILIALNRPEELRLHVGGALNNGCSKEEIVETILQAAAYCGVPAGGGGFRVAQEVFRERGL